MAIPNVTLNTKTYTLSADQNGIIRWAETSGGVPSGFSELTDSLRGPLANVKSPAFRVDSQLIVPVVAVADTACVCAGGILRDMRFNVQVLWNPQSTVAERTDGALRFKDWVATTVFQNQIINSARPY